jgi:hypothetical protein
VTYVSQSPKLGGRARLFSAGCDSFRSKELRMGAGGKGIHSDDTTRDTVDPTILPLENRSVWLYSVKT